MSYGLGKMLCGLLKVSVCLWNVSDCLMKLLDFLGRCKMVSGRCQMVSGRCQMVFFTAGCRRKEEAKLLYSAWLMFSCVVLFIQYYLSHT